MAKIYSTEQKAFHKMTPKKETISFLLNYSRALKVLETKLGKLEIIVN